MAIKFGRDPQSGGWTITDTQSGMVRHYVDFQTFSYAAFAALLGAQEQFEEKLTRHLGDVEREEIQSEGDFDGDIPGWP